MKLRPACDPAAAGRLYEGFGPFPQFISQGVPNWSTSTPKRCAQKVSCKGISTEPPSVEMPDGDRSFYANSVTPVDYEACLHSIPPGPNKSEKPEEFCVRFPQCEDYIVVDLIQHIDDKYRTLAKREARAISRESAGGFGAMELALRHKDLFGSVASHPRFFSLLYAGPHPYKRDQVVFRETIDPNMKILQERINGFGRDIANWRAHDPYLWSMILKTAS